MVSKKMYWTKDTDKAILDFIDEKNLEKRNIIYEKNIHKPFTIMIESLVNKLQIKKFKDYERDMDTLKSICFIKFFEMFDLNNEKIHTYIDTNKGRPFNYLTTVVRNEILQYTYKIYKKRTQIETNYIDNEEFLFNESGDDAKSASWSQYNENFTDKSSSNPDSIDQWEIYKLIIKLLKRDLKNNVFTSEKEKLFGEQLLYLMENINIDFKFYNKFFIKMLLAELTGFKRTSINYYLGKVYSKYIEEIKDLYERAV
jgi:hypothetical protein